MDLDLMEMWHAMNPVVKSAVIVLTIQGLWGVTVTIDRLLMLFMSKRPRMRITQMRHSGSGSTSSEKRW